MTDKTDYKAALERLKKLDTFGNTSSPSEDNCTEWGFNDPEQVEEWLCESYQTIQEALKIADRVQSGNEIKEPGKCDDKKVMNLWREAGLPECFLGRSGTNHRLVLFSVLCAREFIKGGAG